MGWLSPCVCEAWPWPTHMAELPCWGARGSARRRRFALLSVTPLVFGAFLEAPKSYRRDSQTVAKLSSIRTQRSLFHWIPRSFGHPNMAKRRRISSKGADWGPCRGSPAPGGSASRPPYLLDRGPRPWPTPMAELPSWGAPGGRLRGLVLVFWVRVLWFSGLFSKHRSRINAILEPLRSYLRYGRNGPCFVGFQGRLVIQTWRNVEGYRRKGLTGDPTGGPLPLGVG